MGHDSYSTAGTVRKRKKAKKIRVLEFRKTADGSLICEKRFEDTGGSWIPAEETVIAKGDTGYDVISKMFG